MRRTIISAAAAVLLLVMSAKAEGQLLYPFGGAYAGPYDCDPWGYSAFGYSPWTDPLYYGGRFNGWGGWNFGGLGYVGPSAPAWFGRPVIYVRPQAVSVAPYLAAYSQPVKVGIEFLPLDFATPDLNTGAPALTDPVVAVDPSVAASIRSLTDADLAILARHLRKTSGNETRADIAEAAARVRRTSVAAKMRASKFLDVGDALFHEQKYHEALQRYKSASGAAPDMAETWLRQGFALAATGRYDLAAKAFLRAEAIDPAAKEARLTLDDLYRDAEVAKSSHYDALARTALAEPERSELLYILGMLLHFDGQRERAVSFFAAAKELEADAAASAAAPMEAAEPEAPIFRKAKAPAAAPVIPVGVET